MNTDETIRSDPGNRGIVRKSRAGVEYFYPVSSVASYIQSGKKTSDGRTYVASPQGNLIRVS